MKKRWIILMTIMVIIAFGGLFAGEPSFECDMSKIDGADVAWLITATIFVLMMTPGNPRLSVTCRRLTGLMWLGSSQQRSSF